MNKTTSIDGHACSPYDLFNVGWVIRAVCGVTHQAVGHGPTPCRMAWEGGPLRCTSRRADSVRSCGTANELQEGDNSPVGLLLCSGKDTTKVEYATAGMDSNSSFTAISSLYLPPSNYTRSSKRTALLSNRAKHTPPMHRRTIHDTDLDSGLPARYAGT